MVLILIRIAICMIILLYLKLLGKSAHREFHDFRTL